MAGGAEIYQRIDMCFGRNIATSWIRSLVQCAGDVQSTTMPACLALFCGSTWMVTNPAAHANAISAGERGDFSCQGSGEACCDGLRRGRGLVYRLPFTVAAPIWGIAPGSKSAPIVRPAPAGCVPESRAAVVWK
jgi:hypothetical protein